jgi:hypothetical protein
VKTHKITALALLVLQMAFLVGVCQTANAQRTIPLGPCSTPPPGLIGDMNGDCNYNLVDVVWLIQVVFIAPPDPWPLNGDVNCDHYIDIFDVLRLANFVFAKGPALQPCPDWPQWNDSLGVLKGRPLDSRVINSRK